MLAGELSHKMVWSLLVKSYVTKQNSAADLIACGIPGSKCPAHMPLCGISADDCLLTILKRPRAAALIYCLPALRSLRKEIRICAADHRIFQVICLSI